MCAILLQSRSYSEKRHVEEEHIEIPRIPDAFLQTNTPAVEENIYTAAVQVWFRMRSVQRGGDLRLLDFADAKNRGLRGTLYFTRERRCRNRSVAVYGIHM